MFQYQRSAWKGISVLHVGQRVGGLKTTSPLLTWDELGGGGKQRLQPIYYLNEKGQNDG